MSADWPEIPLGDVVSFKTGKLDSNAAEENGRFPFFTCSPTTLAINSYAFDTEAVILAGNNANGVFSTKHYSGKFNAYQRTYVIEPIDKATVSCRYVYFVISHMVGHLKELSIGSATKFLTKTILNALPVRIPPKVEQDEIALLLSTLDDRITLLRETNATLEAIAQALFKSWFVDFDPVRAKLDGRAPEGMDDATARLFPDSFEESELGLVPRGWRVGSLENCCSRVESGGTPKRTIPEYWDGDVSWLTSGEVRNPIVFDTKEKITALGVKESSAKLWPSGTTVVAMYGATAGEVCLLAQPTTANQACCGLIPSDHFRAFLFFCTRKERENLASKSSGSAQQNLNKGLVCGHQVLIPSVPVASAYETVVGALLNSWIENEKLAQTLATLRDTLLPRLISGQLRLQQAQAAAEDALA
jgi:type I restriction enzyme S subunit